MPEVYIGTMKKKKTIILLASLVLTVIALILRMAWVETSFFRVNEYTVTLENLPPEHDGLTVAVMGDLHLKRASFENGFYDAVSEVIREKSPDLVLLLGDYLSAKDRRSLLEVDNMCQTVSKWHGKYGTLAIAGNHDVYFEKAGNLAYVEKALKKAGFTVLDGSGVSLDIHGKPFQIAGVADRENSWCRMGKIPADFDRSFPVYGMIHNPEEMYSVRNNYDMIFSAHTHRGQLRMPVFGERYLLLLYRRGWFGSGVRKHGKCVQFITSGLGTSAWPVRLYDLPEIAWVTLRCPAVSR